MKINFARLRVKSASDRDIDLAVFEARSAARNDSGNAKLLAELTGKARLGGHKIDESALIYMVEGRLKMYGSKHLVHHMADLQSWTHIIDI